MSHKASIRNKPKRREPWTSHNRVLTGIGSKKVVNIGRNPNFDTDETKLLIQLWGDPKVQRTLITTHKKHAVLCQLATRMQEYGYIRSAEEITTRIKNLKCFYNRLKKDMEASGTPALEPTWKHYADMDAIMTRPIFSVRPNEVPAPSLKYQMEQKKEERAERKRRAMEEGKILTDSDDDLEDIVARNGKNKSKGKHDIDDGIIPDVEVDIETADESFVAFTNAAEQSMAKAAKKRKFSKAVSDASSSFDDALETDDQDGEARLFIKEEENSDSDSEEDEQTLAKIRSNSKRKCNVENSESRNTKTINAKEIESSHSINENTSDSCVALIIPKDEPIDVDADDDEEEAEINSKKISAEKKLKPSLSDMLKVAISSAGNILIPVSNVTTTNSASVATVVGTLGNTITTSTIKQTSLTPMQQSKISLVPTNFLMPQKTSTANGAAMTSTIQTTQQPTLTMPTSSLQLLKGPMTQRIVLGNATTNKPTTAASTGIVTTGPGGMKVLLVNADQTKAATVGSGHIATNLGMANSTRNNVIPLGATASAIVGQQQSQHLSSQTQQHQTLQNQQQQQQQQQQQKKQQEEEEAKEAQRLQRRKLLEQHRLVRREELLNKRETTGMRILLRQLLNAQTENNEIQRTRLTLERERLEFEKSIAERFLSSLPSLMTAFTQQHQQPQQQQPQHQFIFQQQKNQPQTTQLRINPQQLVFATGALPTTTLTSVPITTTGNCNPVLSTAVPTVTPANTKAKSKTATETCTQLSDLQLLTPKVEDEDSI